MRSLCLVVVLAACGTSGPDVTITTHFDITRATGAGMSPLDVLVGKTLDVEITLDAVHTIHEDVNDCKSTTFGPYPAPATRVAKGETAAVVQQDILDRLPDWDVRLQLCPNPSQSIIVVEAVIDALNLSFGCAGVPGSAQVYSGGYPALTSFTATSCNSVILDVVNNRDLGNDSFALTIATGPDRIPGG